MSAAILAIVALVAIPFAKLRLIGKAKRFAFTKLLNICLNIGLNLFFYWEIMWPETAIFSIYDPLIGVGYVFLANLIANSVFLILLADMLLKFRFSVQLAHLKKILKYSIPLVFTGLAGVTNEMVSRAMLKYRLPEGFYGDMSNIDALGVFGACYKLSIFMALSIQAFKYAAEPFFFTSADKKDSPKLFSRVMQGYVVFACLLLFAVTINLNFLGWLFLGRDSYRDGLDVVPYLLLGGLFLGIYYNLSVWYKLTDHTTWAAYISGIGAFVSIALNWLLIPVYGYMGSAYVTVITYFLMVCISFYVGQKKYPVPYRTLRGSVYIVLTFLISMLMYHFNPLTGLIMVLANGVVIVLAVILVMKIEKINISKVLKR